MIAKPLKDTAEGGSKFYHKAVFLWPEPPRTKTEGYSMKDSTAHKVGNKLKTPISHLLPSLVPAVCLMLWELQETDSIFKRLYQAGISHPESNTIRFLLFCMHQEHSPRKLSVSHSLLIPSQAEIKAFTWQNTWFYILPTMDTSYAVFLSFQQAWLPHTQDALREHSICRVVSCNLYPFTCYDLTWDPRGINLSLVFIPAVPFPFIQRYKSSGWSYDSTSEVLAARGSVIRPQNTSKSSSSSNL